MTSFRTQYGPWAVVTGASSGIGRAFAGRLAERGLHLVLVARRGGVLDTLAADLTASHGTETRTVAADLGTESGLADLEAATADLDVGLLVASAGFGTSGAFLESDLGDEVNMLDVNGRAVLRQVHHFGRRLAERGRGGLILLGSLVGFQGTPFAAHYAATKAYVQTLGEALHVELKPMGVDVLVCAPGPVRTGFAERADMRMGATVAPDDVAEPTLAALGRRQTVRPGLLTKVLSGGLALLPRWGKVRMMARVMGGMTAHQTSA
ncbi:MAG: SDR family NAD(P)-dependent oxidoreductase [Bacteroidota bacterium]